MNNKRGMSAIVTTVIMVALALVAIGIVWAVIGNIIGTSASETAITAKCLKVNLVVDSAACVSSGAPGTTCTVGVSRKSGGETIDGVKIVLSGPTYSTPVIEKDVELEALGSTTLTDTAIPYAALIGTLNKAKVTPYFKDDSGNKIDCATTAELNL